MLISPNFINKILIFYSHFVPDIYSSFKLFMTIWSAMLKRCNNLNLRICIDSKRELRFWFAIECFWLIFFV